MKKILLLIIVLGAGYYYYTLQEEPHQNDKTNHSIKSKIANKQPSDAKGSSSASIGAGGKIVSSGKKPHSHVHSDSNFINFEVEDVPVPDTRDGESLTAFNDIMSEFATQNLDEENLKESLISKGLELVVAKDENKFTGTMTIIRTENSLPGTRYFHSQIFYGDDGKPFIQHMSFEYRAGKLAFAEAVAAAKKQFGLTHKPSVQKDGFYSWNTSDGYVVWVKRMTAEDQKNDPYNAYSANDVGTIKIAKELEIH